MTETIAFLFPNSDLGTQLEKKFYFVYASSHKNQRKTFQTIAIPNVPNAFGRNEKRQGFFIIKNVLSFVTSLAVIPAKAGIYHRGSEVQRFRGSTIFIIIFFIQFIFSTSFCHFSYTFSCSNYSYRFSVL